MPKSNKNLRISADDEERGGKTTPMSPEEIQETEKKRVEFEKELETGEDIPDTASYTSLEVLMFHHNFEEIFVTDPDGALYGVFVSPDNNRVLVQPITMVMKREPPMEYPRDETGEFPWGTITEEIFPEGVIPTDVRTAKVNASASSSFWKKVVSKMLDGYSCKQYYIENVSKNPYLAK